MADLWHSMLRWLLLALISLSFVRLVIALCGRGIAYAMFIAAFFFFVLDSRLRREVMMAVSAWQDLVTMMIIILIILFCLKLIIGKVR